MTAKLLLDYRRSRIVPKRNPAYQRIHVQPWSAKKQELQILRNVALATDM